MLITHRQHDLGDIDWGRSRGTGSRVTIETRLGAVLTIGARRKLLTGFTLGARRKVLTGLTLGARRKVVTSATLGTGSALKAGLRSVPIVGIAIIGETATLRTQDRLKIVGYVLTTLAAIGAELLRQERGNGDGILATAVGELFGQRTEPLGQRVL